MQLGGDDDSAVRARSMGDRCDALVLFGATGDLARKKLFPALHAMAGADRLPARIVGVGRSDWTDDDLRRYAVESAAEFGRHADDDADERLAATLRFVSGDYRDPATYDAIAAAVDGATRPLVYLAVPPSVFEDVVEGLAAAGLSDHGRIVVEKPFGRDLSSARTLDECLLSAYPEDSVFRIDHFLGKEQLLDLLVFRLANVILEPAWNRHYVASVQITMAEDFGVEGRGGFYDEVGALRDVLQNHLLQVVTLVAMEPPVAADARALRDEKVKVLRSITSPTKADVVRGQFAGYRDEDGVADDSDVETYVALRLELDSWRWAGVPFYLRTGKHLAATVTEVLVEFKRPPRLFFADDDAPLPHPNHLRFRIKPGERVSLGVQIKEPGEGLVSRGIELSYRYEEHREGVRDDAYARLLDDALDGDQRLFARADGVEEAWRIVDPLLADPGPVEIYERGSWGPPAADDLVAGDGGWHDPDLGEDADG